MIQSLGEKEVANSLNFEHEFYFKWYLSGGQLKTRLGLQEAQ